ncbi:MAG TPA: hypothetical protein VKE88_00920 [Candidatus Nanoarchaeia archaeon]|nr:hypothetical protein [Candidatus Nanoarchaeia archaeon]
MKKQTILIIVILVVSLFAYVKFTAPNYDDFASCITDEGATFYGAFWCPHCLDQKKAFGSSIKHILYIECSSPDGNSQTQACKDAGVESYPTWKFADGSTIVGEATFEQLSAKTGCPLP